MNKKKNKLQPRPEVGKFYPFWDDGKTSSSRHYTLELKDGYVVFKFQRKPVIPQELKSIINNKF